MKTTKQFWEQQNQMLLRADDTSMDDVIAKKLLEIEWEEAEYFKDDNHVE